MNSICILLTDHKSINDLIIKKSLSTLKRSKLKKIFFIGDKQKFKQCFKISKSTKNIFFIEIKEKNNFNYLRKITLEGINLFKKKKIKYLINMPLDKKRFLKNKYVGYTEFFSSFFSEKNNHNMLLYNEDFSVCPLTTHIEIKNVYKKINKKKIKNTIDNIYFFYKKIIKHKIQIIVLGLNPHASKDLNKSSIDNIILKPVIKKCFKKGMNIIGPVSADTAFQKLKNKVFVGMYHDQVLIPFKMKNKFNGINITIGNNIIRLSPNHGTATDLKNKNNKINNQSFVKCIEFCEKY